MVWMKWTKVTPTQAYLSMRWSKFFFLKFYYVRRINTKYRYERALLYSARVWAKLNKNEIFEANYIFTEHYRCNGNYEWKHQKKTLTSFTLSAYFSESVAIVSPRIVSFCRHHYRIENAKIRNTLRFLCLFSAHFCLLQQIIGMTRSASFRLPLSTSASISESIKATQNLFRTFWYSISYKNDEEYHNYFHYFIWCDKCIWSWWEGRNWEKCCEMDK